MPSHGISPRANLNILNACYMASDDVEVLIRDNSGNEAKREFLSHVHEKNCHIMSVDECSIAENYQGLLKLASGEFVFLVCDDDFVNAAAVDSILSRIDAVKDDPGVIAISGITTFDDPGQSHFARFNGLEVQSPSERVSRFLGEPFLSVFQFSPLRLHMLRSAWSFWSTVPMCLVYHDLLICCLFLMHGRTTHVERSFYHYNNLNWTTPEAHGKMHEQYLRNAGLDTSVVRFVWLLACVEGAQSSTCKYQGVSMPQDERDRCGLPLFEFCFKKFMSAVPFQPEGARFDRQAVQLVEKWRNTREITIEPLLADIVEHFSLSSPEFAQRYYSFWS